MIYLKSNGLLLQPTFVNAFPLGITFKAKEAAMTSSKMIAGLIGPTLAAIAVAMLLNIRAFPAMVEQVARDPALIFLSGVLLFVAGLAILRAHNIWTGGWPVLVTLLGAFAVLSGLGRMFFPIRLAAIAGEMGQSRGLIAGSAVVLLLIGGFLSFKAYSRD